MLVKIQTNYPNTPGIIVPLQKKFFCIIDKEKSELISKYHWYAKKSGYCFYAVAKIKKNGKTVFLRMHRLIANTPPELVCHHVNHNPLDNRILNLQNMTWFEHAKYYSYR